MNEEREALLRERVKAALEDLPTLKERCRNCGSGCGERDLLLLIRDLDAALSASGGAEAVGVVQDVEHWPLPEGFVGVMNSRLPIGTKLYSHPAEPSVPQGVQTTVGVTLSVERYNELAQYEKDAKWEYCDAPCEDPFNLNPGARCAYNKGHAGAHGGGRPEVTIPRGLYMKLQRAERWMFDQYLAGAFTPQQAADHGAIQNGLPLPPPPDAPRKDLGSSRSVASSGVDPECPTAVAEPKDSGARAELERVRLLNSGELP